MIRFIATDLDGTLLDDGRRLPDGIFDLVEQLHRRGVLFAPASGRQYANLRKLFAPVADKVVFICENGALVKYRDETLRLCPIADEYIKSALDEIRALPRLQPMLCGENSAYIETDAMPFYKAATDSYDHCKRVENLDAVIGKEPICKIAIYDEIAAAENGFKKLPPKIPQLRTILSGHDWFDVSSPDSDKGKAIRVIREKFGIAKDECVAFGDHMNDYEMLLACGRAYVTANAYPPLKELVKNVVPSNREGGVVVKIKELMKEGKL